jgi:hypothetical protein
MLGTISPNLMLGVLGNRLELETRDSHLFIYYLIGDCPLLFWHGLYLANLKESSHVKDSRCF